MHLSFITLALVYRVIRTGRGVMWAIVAFSLLALSNLVYAYMMAITILVLFLFGLNQANLVPRTVRVGVVVVMTALIASYLVVPLTLESEYLNASPLLQPEKYASFGILRVGGWLLTGDLLDHARLPVLSVLLLIGIAAAVLGRMRPALAALTLLVVWVVLYAGRPTLGPLANLLPFSDGLLFHRFVGGVHLAAILLIGVGGAVMWGLFAPHRRAWQSLAAAFVVGAIFLPAYAERADFHRINDTQMRRSMAAISADQDATDVLATLKSLPPGRTYAGLRTNWGQAMTIADVPFYNLLPFEGIESITPNQSITLNADLLWDFDERDASDYELFNVRYVVAPTPLPMPDFLRALRETPTYTLYEAPSGGYALYGSIVARQAFSSQRDLYYNNREWLLGDTLPANHQFIRYDYPARTPGPPPTSGACKDGEVSFELFQPGRMDFVVGCPTDGSLVIKTTFHPDWRVSVDGVPVEAYMVSPSYIGVDLIAGRHQVTAEYRPDPLKLPLLLLGLAVLLLVVIAGPRMDDAVAAFAGRLPQPHVSLPPMPWTAPARRRRAALAGSGLGGAPPPGEPSGATPEPSRSASMSAAAAALSAAVAARAVARPSAPEQPSIATAPLVEEALEEEAARPSAEATRDPLAATQRTRIDCARGDRPRASFRAPSRCPHSGSRGCGPASAAERSRRCRLRRRPSGDAGARGRRRDHPPVRPRLPRSAGRQPRRKRIQPRPEGARAGRGRAPALLPRDGRPVRPLRRHRRVRLAPPRCRGLHPHAAARDAGPRAVRAHARPTVSLDRRPVVSRPRLRRDRARRRQRVQRALARRPRNEPRRRPDGARLAPAPIPSPYGPLWTDVEGIVMGITTRVPLAILVFKAIATLASLGSIWLVWRILGRVTPDRQLLGTVLFAWNPVIIVELAGEGHNDALMLFFALAGLYATVRLRPAASLVATTLGTLTKVVPALILPPQLVYLWRSRRQDPTIVTGLVIGGLASLAIAVILFVPVWVGPQTFEGLRVSSEPGPWPTVSGALYRFIERTRPDVDAGLIVRVIVQGLFVLFVVAQSLRVRTARDVLHASAWIAVAYVCSGRRSTSRGTRCSRWRCSRWCRGSGRSRWSSSSRSCRARSRRSSTSSRSTTRSRSLRSRSRTRGS